MEDIKIKMAENSLELLVDVDFLATDLPDRLRIVTFNLYWRYLWLYNIMVCPSVYQLSLVVEGHWSLSGAGGINLCYVFTKL